MLFSEIRGWQDVARMHPTVPRLMLFYVVPMSLIPPAMFVFAVASGGGELFPALVPSMSLAESLLVAAVFFAAEIGMVLLMGSLIRETGELVDAQLPYGDALLLAAIAPTPLWLGSLALLVPSLPVIASVLAIAWLGCAALVRHGVTRLFSMTDAARARILARHVLAAGVLAWLALMILQALLLSMLIGWR
jgi:hypothetical protein